MTETKQFADNFNKAKLANQIYVTGK